MQYDSEHDEPLWYPRPPQFAAALRQVPLSQTPELLEPQFEPAATHWPLTQHPSPAQTLPPQQGSPGPPQVAHLPPEQPRPDPVQKLDADRLLEPAQQLCPSPPQLPHPPSAVSEQLPLSVPPQAAPGATHFPPAQQAPPAQVLLSQQGWFVPPHAWRVPATQTVLGLVPEAPGATQRCAVASRHAPFEHVDAPGHGGVPATPQYSHSFFAKQP